MTLDTRSRNFKKKCAIRFNRFRSRERLRPLLDRFGRDTKRRKFLFYVTNMLSQATREKDSITTNKYK